MPEEKSLSLIYTVDNDDKVRVVSSDGLSHSIEVGHLKSSLSIDDLSDKVSALEIEANTNNTAHDDMDFRIGKLETTVGDEGDGETELSSGLVKTVSEMKLKLDRITPEEIDDHGTHLSEIDGRLTLIDGENGQLHILTDGQANLEDLIDAITGRLTAIDAGSGRLALVEEDVTNLEEDVTDLTDTKLDQSAFQSAVAAGFKMINKTPARATATGEPGEVCWDAEYFYVCIETNTWKRIQLQDW